MSVQARLSQESYDFVKNKDRFSDFSTIRTEINRYVNDLDNVIKSVCEELQSLQWGLNDWKIEKKRSSDDLDNIPAVSYQLSGGSEYDSANSVTVHLDYSGDSFIELKKNSSPDLKGIATDHVAKEIRTFKKTAAYKRYYEDLSSKDQLRFIAPVTNKMITSRNLVDYLVHLIMHLSPVIALGCQQALELQEAA